MRQLRQRSVGYLLERLERSAVRHAPIIGRR
jgi:hypothetical protein